MRIIFSMISLILLTAAMAFSQEKLLTYVAASRSPIQAQKYEEFLEFGCSLGCAIGWEFESTSTLEPQKGNLYNASNLGDGKLATAWVEGTNGYGIGEKIIIRMNVAPSLKNIPFRGLDFVNGFAKSAKTWSENSRVKLLKVYHNNRPVFFIKLHNTKTPQNVTFPPLLINIKDTVTLEITEVYRGTKFSDTAISEINLYGAH